MARKPKSGYVYLLKNVEDCERNIFKYGCTTRTPKERCAQINRENKKYGYKFEVIASFYSSDVFKSENEIKWDILPSGFGALSEFIDTTDFYETEKEIIIKFLKIGKVLEKGAINALV